MLALLNNFVNASLLIGFQECKKLYDTVLKLLHENTPLKHSITFQMKRKERSII